MKLPLTMIRCLIWKRVHRQDQAVALIPNKGRRRWAIDPRPEGDEPWGRSGQEKSEAHARYKFGVCQGGQTKSDDGTFRRPWIWDTSV